MTCPVVARGRAADLPTTVARLVQRGSVQHGGKPIKWLGVMFYFRDPAQACVPPSRWWTAWPTPGFPLGTSACMRGPSSSRGATTSATL
jgi:adenylate cyclase